MTCVAARREIFTSLRQMKADIPPHHDGSAGQAQNDGRVFGTGMRFVTGLCQRAEHIERQYCGNYPPHETSTSKQGPGLAIQYLAIWSCLRLGPCIASRNL